MKNWQKICCDHRSDRITGDLLPSNVLCVEGRFFAEGVYSIVIYCAVCGGYVLCDFDAV